MKRIKMFFQTLKNDRGIGVVEVILILVENFPLYIACIEGEKTLKRKLYTLYTQ